ncbi:restriction endonuclease subunit S [Methanobrevibacter smithii]|uniref:restriction endonuclease subunit S n=1 Tax=Methanobrevibacter smithii TaxID=2173 RepID=UPI0037DC9D65
MSLDKSQNDWGWIKAKDFMLFNPKESIKKGTVVKNVPMDKIEPKTKEIPSYELTEYKGGVKFRNGDILMARITPCLENGKISQVSILDYNEIGAGSTEFIVLREKEGISDKDFIYYLSNSEYFKEPAIKSMVGSSGRQRVQRDVVENLEIYVPPLETQKKIGKVLSFFDKKISLNKKINKNLEEQLETLYNSFFVYYDDFLKEDLEECEIGLIPKEWSLLSLGDVTTKINEKVGSNDYKVFSAVNTGNLILSEEYFDKQVYSKSIEKYIVVKQKEFAYNPARINIGSIGRNDFGFDGCVSPVYVAFKVEEGYENFMNMYIKSNRFNQWVITLSSGSVRQTLNYNDFSIIKIAYPPKELINKFNTIYDSYYEVINYNKSVINNLEKIRDLLLPKLMSGEIDVSQINCDLELKYNYMKYLFNQIHTPMSKSVV